LFQCLALKHDLHPEYGILQFHMLQAFAHTLGRCRNAAMCCHPIPCTATSRVHSETLVTLKIY